MRITNQLISAFIKCQYKAFLLATGVKGELSNYETFVQYQEEEYARCAASAFFGPESRNVLDKNVPVTFAELNEGVATLPNVYLEEGTLAITLHGIKQVTGASLLGPHHYEPILFGSFDRSGEEENRIILAVGGIALRQLQGVYPEHGAIVHGVTFKSHRVDLMREQPKVEKIVADLSDLLTGIARPSLRLNENCRLCRYQHRCLGLASN